MIVVGFQGCASISRARPVSAGQKGAETTDDTTQPRSSISLTKFWCLAYVSVILGFLFHCYAQCVVVVVVEAAAAAAVVVVAMMMTMMMMITEISLGRQLQGSQRASQRILLTTPTSQIRKVLPCGLGHTSAIHTDTT